MKHSHLILSICLMLSMAWAAPDHKKGDGDGYFKKKLNKITKALDLDEKQREEVEQIKLKAHEEFYKLHLEIEKKNIELKEILIEDMDLNKIKLILEARSKIIVEKEYLRFKSDADIRKILSEEQWKKYILLKERMKKKKGHKHKHHKRH